MFGGFEYWCIFMYFGKLYKSYILLGSNFAYTRIQKCDLHSLDFMNFEKSIKFMLQNAPNNLISRAYSAYFGICGYVCWL